jgi:hypothetical protein
MDNVNRRSSPRINKTYTFTYHAKGVEKWDTSVAKNISRGGICFNSPTNYPAHAVLVMEMTIPYLAPAKTFLEAEVLVAREISAGKMYEIRAKFVNLTPDVTKALDLIEQKNVKDRRYGSH